MWSPERLQRSNMLIHFLWITYVALGGEELRCSRCNCNFGGVSLDWRLSSSAARQVVSEPAVVGIQRNSLI